eukprot:TRINITY_DN63518_c0_g1_i1.p2 TRINITY_DN63518_c0_g1~~TRINITY_DN63518_c0_g1_i1.p2  ORF type:complete len:116 (+),score=13.20 TRINITY_DN63518_c0_g1_i1:171-518(+)
MADDSTYAFCPHCANLLLLEAPGTGASRFFCRTCPYIFTLPVAVAVRTKFTPKPVDDILGGEDAWKNVDTTDVQCPERHCESTTAYFQMLQTRSADEPMTIFLKCTVCGHQWNEY